MRRRLTRELLDFLPPDDPAARHSRRDLRIFNAVLGGARWLARTVRARARPGERRLEIGAGAGLLAARLAADGLDLGPRPADWPAARVWHQTDAVSFDGWRVYDVVFANLFFHHLDQSALRLLGGHLAEHARVIVACEPVRRRPFQWLFAALCVLVRANHVSRHDGRVSIEAGFLGDELPVQLGLDPAKWRWEVTVTARGMYRMVAERRAR